MPTRYAAPHLTCRFVILFRTSTAEISLVHRKYVYSFLTKQDCYLHIYIKHLVTTGEQSAPRSHRFSETALPTSDEGKVPPSLSWTEPRTSSPITVCLLGYLGTLIYVLNARLKGRRITMAHVVERAVIKNTSLHWWLLPPPPNSWNTGTDLKVICRTPVRQGDWS
jgi:hypothetical protein